MSSVHIFWMQNVRTNIIECYLFLLAALGMDAAGDLMIHQSKSKSPKRGPRTTKKPSNAPKRFKRCERPSLCIVQWTCRAQPLLVLSSFFLWPNIERSKRNLQGKAGRQRYDRHICSALKFDVFLPCLIPRSLSCFRLDQYNQNGVRRLEKHGPWRTSQVWQDGKRRQG